MIDTHETPDYKGSTQGGPARPIAPRKLSEAELKELQELLPIYETSLKEISQKRKSNAMSQRNTKSHILTNNTICTDSATIYAVIFSKEGRNKQKNTHRRLALTKLGKLHQT